MVTLPIDQKELFTSLKKQGITAFNNKFSYRTLKSKNFEVATIIDVGVFNGTQAVYDAFPTAEIILVEPIPGAAETVRRKLNGRKVHAYECAAGSSVSKGKFRLNASGGKSSLLDRSKFYPTEVEREIEVDIRPLDDITARHSGPFGLKIDTEGFELEALRGATETIRKSSFVLIETSVKRRFATNYRFSEIIAEMARHDFELLDVLNAAGGEPYFFDCLFVPYRSDRFDRGR